MKTPGARSYRNLRPEPQAFAVRKRRAIEIDEKRAHRNDVCCFSSPGIRAIGDDEDTRTVTRQSTQRVFMPGERAMTHDGKLSSLRFAVVKCLERESVRIRIERPEEPLGRSEIESPRVRRA